MIKIKKVIVDYRIDVLEKVSLENLGYEVLACPPNNNLYEAVCGHPDMLLHFLDGDSVVVHCSMEEGFIKSLKLLGFNVFLSGMSLEKCYPGNVGLNAVSLNDFFIHNLKYTDSVILDNTKCKKLINVKQGYSKCSTAIINNYAVMTSDRGICKALRCEGIDVLLLPPGDIILPGLDYGFIGGCCGLLEKDVLAFYGDLDFYAYRKEILDFLKKHRVKPVFLRRGKLVDRGTIFSLDI